MVLQKKFNVENNPHDFLNSSRHTPSAKKFWTVNCKTEKNHSFAAGKILNKILRGIYLYIKVVAYDDNNTRYISSTFLIRIAKLCDAFWHPCLRTLASYSLETKCEYAFYKLCIRSYRHNRFQPWPHDCLRQDSFSSRL